MAYTLTENGTVYQSAIIDRQFENIKDDFIKTLNESDIDGIRKVNIMNKLDEITDLSDLKDFVIEIKEEINGETI